MVFDVNQPFGGIDGIEKELADFEDRFVAAAALGNLGPADRHPLGGKRKARVENEWPWFAVRRGQIKAVATNSLPTLLEEFRQLLNDGSDVIGLQVVEGAIARAVAIDSQWIVRPMIALIPAAGAKIDAADKTESAVDDDELLMMRGIERFAAVVAELEALVSVPIEIPILKPFPVEAV